MLRYFILFWLKNMRSFIHNRWRWNQMETKLGTFQDVCSGNFLSIEEEFERAHRVVFVFVSFFHFILFLIMKLPLWFGSLSHIIHLFRPHSYRWSKSYNSIMYSNRNLINFILVLPFVGGIGHDSDGINDAKFPVLEKATHIFMPFKFYVEFEYNSIFSIVHKSSQ